MIVEVARWATGGVSEKNWLEARIGGWLRADEGVDRTGCQILFKMLPSNGNPLHEDFDILGGKLLFLAEILEF